MISTVIFDFDGTIADTIPKDQEILKIFNKIANENNFKNITLAQIKDLRHVGLYESIKVLKIPFYKVPFLAKKVRKITKTDLATAKPVKQMPEILNELKDAKYTLGILTSNKKKTVEKFLKTYNLEIFDFIYSGTNLFGKDRLLKSLSKKEKIDLNASVYVGDEIRDIQAAKKTNLQTIAVTWGYNSKQGLSKWYPDYIAQKPSDILMALTKLTF